MRHLKQQVINFAFIPTLCIIAILFSSCSNDENKTKPSLVASEYALVDLHLHIDGSLSVESMIEMAKLSDITLPTYNHQELKKMLQCPDGAVDLNDYLECFYWPNVVMQKAESISYALYGLVKELDKEGLIYAELRFAPQIHTENGLTQEEVVEAAIQGMKKALAESDIETQLILCAMRYDNYEAQNLKTVELAKKYLGNGVAAVDLAGAEGLYPTENYASLFEYAQQLGVPFTIHAGEAAGVESMNYAMDYAAKRIGHGIRSYDSPSTKSRLVEQKVTLELCPTSNLNTKALDKVTSIEQYPINDFFKDGVLVTINTDNTMVSNTSLKNEFEKLITAGLINREQAIMLVENAIDAAFLNDSKKTELRTKARKRMGVQ